MIILNRTRQKGLLFNNNPLQLVVFLQGVIILKGTRQMAGKPHNLNYYILKNNYCELVIFNKRKNKKITAFISIKDIEKVKKGHWCACYDKTINNYYIRGRINEKQIQLHRYITNCPNNLVVDHINRNTLDNRQENLRCITQNENNQNRKELWKTNKSGYRCISWHKSNNKWVIQYKGKHIVCAKTLEEAITLRDNFLKGGEAQCQ